MSITSQNVSPNAVQVIDLIPNIRETCLLLKGVFDEKFFSDLQKKAINKQYTCADEKYPVSYRNNDRHIEDNKILASQLFGYCKNHIPATIIANSESLTLSGLNSMLRYCKYSSGQAFSIHQDGVYHKNKRQQSVLTFLLYINDSKEFEGGATGFFADQSGNKRLATYHPQAGDMVVFDHALWHSGEEVIAGEKYILRSDFIFSGPVPRLSSAQYGGRQHDGYIWKVLNLTNNLFATASRDKSIKIWNDDMECLQTLKAHQNSVFDIAVNAGAFIAVSRDGYMTKWISSNNKYKLISRIHTTHPCVLSVVPLSDGGVLTSGSDGVVRFWGEDDQLVTTFKTHQAWVWRCLQYSENTFISCDAKGMLIMWESETMSVVQAIRLSNYAVRCMILHGNYLYAGDEAGFVHKLRVPNLKLQQSWKAHSGIVRDVLAFGHAVYSCGEDNQVVKTGDTGEDRKVLHYHTGFATSLALMSSKKLLSASYSGEVNILNI